MPSDVPVFSSVTHNFHISLQTELDQCGFSKKIGTVLEIQETTRHRGPP